MESVNSILETTGLGEEYRKPLIRLQKVCTGYKLNEEQWAAVLQQFLRYSLPSRTIAKLLEKRWQADMLEVASSAKALQTIMQGGVLKLSCAGCKADVSAFRDSLQGIFEERLQQYHSILYTEGVIEPDKLAIFIEGLEQCSATQVQECGAAILDIMGSEEMQVVLDSLETKRAKHILTGEILFTSGALKEYGLAGYWAAAGADNKRKADYVRDWAAAFERTLKAGE